MKLLLFIFMFAFTGVCKAQTPVLSLYDNISGEIDGAYYKDMDNDMDKFVGTWKYTNGTTSLTITLQKKLMEHMVDDVNDYYEDVIIGEYKYIENGIEKINTLPQLAQNLTPFQHNITGDIILGTSNRTIEAAFQDPERPILGMEAYMRFERVDTIGVQKVKAKLYTISGGYREEGVIPEYTIYNVPFGEYVLTKQP